LLQVTATGKTVKARALVELSKTSGDFRLNLIALALKGKKVSFDKVLTMIDDMCALLKARTGSSVRRSKRISSIAIDCCG
jgi:hypothetical protein